MRSLATFVFLAVVVLQSVPPAPNRFAAAIAALSAAAGCPANTHWACDYFCTETDPLTGRCRKMEPVNCGCR